MQPRTPVAGWASESRRTARETANVGAAQLAKYTPYVPSTATLNWKVASSVSPLMTRWINASLQPSVGPDRAQGPGGGGDRAFTSEQADV